ncbi:MAG TPA: DUF2911 domain-containing protein [Mucilaginibacter sp.]|jgi:hypothetical protein
MKYLTKQLQKTFPAKAFMLIIVGLLSLNLAHAQDDKSKRPSPPATATGKIGDATVSVDYSSPSVKGRKIFGGILPYGTLWRAGANEATIFQTDKDLMVEGKKLPAGKYSFFAMPGEKKWTIFFNSETGQWGDKKGGAANMDSAKTVLSFPVNAKKLKAVNEKLEYYITGKGFGFKWEFSDVFVKVK